MLHDRDQDLPGDLSALAWVQEELRRTLDNAHKSLRRHQRALESHAEIDGGSTSPTALLQARQLIHQGAGALAMVGLPAPALLLGSSEQAVLRMIGGQVPVDARTVGVVEKASFALLDYLRRILAGKAVSPLALFPQYRELLTLAGVERIHPSDLWSDAQAQQRVGHAGSAPAVAAPDARLRQAVESQLLKYFRTGDVSASRKISQALATLADQPGQASGGLWSLAAAFFEAQGHGLLATDLYAKRMASRLLAQLRAAERGMTEAPERLLQDLLFFCARARRNDAMAPRLAQVAQVHQLPSLHEVDYEQSSLGRYDPALIPAARRRLATLKETWSAVAAGELAALPALPEQAALVSDSVQQLYPEGGRLARALQSALDSAVREAQTPRTELAMEVATTLLCLDASLDDVDPDQPELQQRIQRLAERLETVSQGKPAPPLEPWVESLYREVSDRQSMGSVVQELRASLAEVEQQLDRFSREPDQRELLVPVPAELAAMRGVLSVLGLDQASLAVQRMRDDVDAVLIQEAEAADLSGKLADNLGALSFLIDMLGVQPQLAKSLFRYDADTGRFSALMGRAAPVAPRTPAEPALIDQVQQLALSAEHDEVSNDDLSSVLGDLADQATAADQPALARAVSEARQVLAQAETEGPAERDAARADVAHSLANFASTVYAPFTPEPAASPVPVDDEPDDMRDIFIEEAREVVATGQEALSRLDLDPQDLEAMTALRRAFHTLKGSSRMVGLKVFGEAAWACEQLFNARLADAIVEAQTPLRNFTGKALVVLSDWVERIADHSDAGLTGQDLIDEAQALRLGTTFSPSVEPLAAAPAPTEAPSLDLPELEASAGSGVPTPSFEQSAIDGLSMPVADTADADAAEPLPTLDLPSTGPVEADAAALDLPALDLAELDLPDLDLPPEPAVAESAPERDTLPDLVLDELDAMPVASVDELPAELGDDLLLPATDDHATDGGAAPAPAEALTLPDLDLSGELLAESVAEAVTAPEAAADEDWPATSHGLSADLQPEAAVDLELDLSAPAPAEVAAAPLDASALMVAADLMDQAAAPSPESLAEAPTMDLGAERLDASEATVSPDDADSTDESDRYKVVGPLRIQIALFNIFLNEADEQSRRLCVELQEWQHELDRPVGDLAVALAHSLAGNSATVGYQELSALARRLEHALERSVSRGQGDVAEVALYIDVAEEIRRLLHQFAAGFLKSVPPELLERLDRHEQSEAGLTSRYEQPDFDDAPVTMMSPLSPLGAVRFSSLEPDEAPRTEPVAAPRVEVSAARADLGSLGEDLDAADALDPELFEIFAEEGRELLPELADQLRQWEEQPGELGAGVAAMRALHTFKGGARLAGAMRLGELAHRLETAIEQLTVRGVSDPAVLAQLHAGADVLAEEFDRLASGGGAAPVAPAAAMVVTAPQAPLAALEQALTAVLPPVAPSAPVWADDPPTLDLGLAQAKAVEVDLPLPANEDMAEGSAPQDGQAPALPAAATRRVDWSRLGSARHAQAAAAAAAPEVGSGSVRVRAPLLDRMVSHAGEVGIARARIETDMGQMQGALKELTDNLERLRRQLRDLELQAETQMSSRIEAARNLQQSFDPLEMDRFTRVQELTRMLAESVNDVGTVQRGIQQTLQDTEDQLAVQARLTRDLQDDLLRARMVEFDTLSDRLYRVVRQAAKESGKQVRLNLIGGGIELDRAVLDRMAPAFEHLLRNAVVHGIEATSLREATGKAGAGNIEVSLRQTGNEVLVEVRDDGAGLDLARIAERGRKLGLLNDDSRPTEAELAGLIFTPGFSTADQVTELAGRGIGMDVVRSEVTAMGGRIETASSTGQGTAFRMVLPLTTAVTQVVLLQAGEQQVAVPSTLVEIVRRVPADEVETAYRSGVLRHGEQDIPFFWLGSLLQQHLRGPIDARTLPVVVVRSAAQLVAVHVSAVLGNQEVVVKNLGPQLSRLPGLAGMSLLASGGTVLIYNPVALTAVYGEDVRRRLLAAPQEQQIDIAVPIVAEPVQKAPLVMVVDDSLTVRRVTQRLLHREGYRVVLAKDGLDALERLADEMPSVMLCDIEMPRMDGFDLVNNVRSDPRLSKLPVIMITSRIADKHQDHARELGVNHYLGKPYDEDLLLSLVRDYAGVATAT